MKHWQIIALSGLLSLLTVGSSAAQSSSSSMTITATVLKAPNQMELSTADTISVGGAGEASSIGQLTLSSPESAGYLINFSDLAEMWDRSGQVFQGRVTGRESGRTGDHISYEILGEFQGVNGTRQASGGNITATIEYY